MNALEVPLLTIPQQLLPLLGVLLLALLLSLLLLVVAGSIGWALATRRTTHLLRWIVWGGLWSALLAPTRLVVEGASTQMVELLGGHLILLGVLLLFLTPWAVFYALRLFASTAAVGREQRYQMGLDCIIAPFAVIRPLLLSLWVWCLGISLLAILFDFGVAEQLQVDTLSVMLYTDVDPSAVLLLHFVALLLLALWLLRQAYRALPDFEQAGINAEKIDAARVKMGVGTYLLLLSSTLLYTSLGFSLGPFLYG